MRHFTLEQEEILGIPVRQFPSIHEKMQPSPKWEHRRTARAVYLRSQAASCVGTDPAPGRTLTRRSLATLSDLQPSPAVAATQDQGSQDLSLSRMVTWYL